ncbi:MAG: GNAT family N-acetyltransferase [Deltaproteobacteria bacterium]|nr:GNAT family N-acetyltransferase [Deltaproteobacteria bacterium]
MFRLRYDIYCKELNVIKENSEEQLYDEFDFNNNTVIFSAVVEGRVAGSIRLIKYSERYGLPLLNEHDHVYYNLQKTLSVHRKIVGGRLFTEAGRFALLQKFRRNRSSDGNLISFMLMLDYIDYCKDNGLTDIIGISNPKLLGFYQKVGFRPLFVVRDELTDIESPVIHGEVENVGRCIKRLKIQVTFLRIIKRFRRFLVEWIKGDCISREK